VVGPYQKTINKQLCTYTYIGTGIETVAITLQPRPAHEVPVNIDDNMILSL
jgi:hypothetical protein